MQFPDKQIFLLLHRLSNGAVFWLRRFFLSGLLLAVPFPTIAEGVYQTPQAFLTSVFTENVPEPQLLWLTGDRQTAATAILGHPPASIRVRYWQHKTRSAWILEEIGKEEPITAGFIVDNGTLQNVQILIYRESRGWEVRYPFFTDQFHGAQLNGEQQLDQPIDNISGATLSVGAITRMARLALYYAGLVNPQIDTGQQP